MTASEVDAEQFWKFLDPWTGVLSVRFSYSVRRRQLSPFEPTQLYLSVYLRKCDIQAKEVLEGLKLLAAVAHGDYNSWKYLLVSHCGVKLGQPWEERAESEIIPQFQLVFCSEKRTEQEFVEMFGYQQHDGPSREYSEALARIAALDNNKLNGVEIPVPIEVVFEKQGSMAKNLAPLLRLQGAGEIIRHGCEEKALPVVEAGAFRCTFVLSATKAELMDVHDLMDLDMAKKTEDLIHNNVLFSRVSVQVHFEERDTTQRREALGRILTSLFDTTRRLYDSLTRPFEADSHAPTTSRRLDQISLSTFVRYGHGRNDWDALFSAAMLNQTTRELKLYYTAPIWHSKYWWQWLAYAVFSKRARTHSSLEVLSLNQIANMTTATMDAFAAILSSERPEELLLGCSAGPTGVQDATLTADSPIQWDFDQQNKPVLSSEVLKLSSPIPFLRILSENEESEWVDAIVPGYGRCQVRRKNLLVKRDNDTVDNLPGNKLETLEIQFYSCGAIDISGLPLFFATVGSSLTVLTIDAGKMDVDVKMVLERCPSLERLFLKNESSVAIFDFADCPVAGLPRPPISFNFSAIPAFTEELMNTDSGLTNCLRRLTIDQSIHPYDQRRMTSSECKRNLDALLKMLESNGKLEYFCVNMCKYHEIEEYLKRFRTFHRQPINRSIKLDTQSKIAFLSVLMTARPPHNEKKRRCQLENKRTNWEDLAANVVTTIFQFAAAPVLREVYVGIVYY